ncbi:MAG TPA: DedA family protein [Thermoflexia bacterium]|nr:DedA family protein [Thermoflexia bacterium]
MGLSHLLDSVAMWVQGIIQSMGYPGLGIVMFLENVFPPIPSEAVLPMAGWLAFEKEGNFTLWGVTLVGALGSVSGALVFYGLGYWFGEQRVRELLRRYGKWMLLTEADFDTALDWFARYGEHVIFFGRMVPIVRSLVSIPAGIAGMNLGRFNLYTAIGTALWSFLLALAGYLLGKNWPLVMEWVGRYEKIVLVLAVVAGGAFVVSRLRQQSKDVEGQKSKV